jgi:hypothetical protein
MDCRTVRQLLDCLQDESLGPAEDDLRQLLSEHLESCPECDRYIEEWRFFDRQVYSHLMSTPVPQSLKGQLLDSVDREFPLSRSIRNENQSKRLALSPRRWAGTLAGVAMLILGICGAWSWYHSDELTYFSGAARQLAACFLRGEVDWQDLDEFDGSFDLDTVQSDLGLFQLSDPHGIDLGGGRGQDAAVFRFGLKGWGGILTVLPSQHYTGINDTHDPRVPIARKVLQWRSADGRFTYICFVQKGSAAELARELFGLMT